MNSINFIKNFINNPQQLVMKMLANNTNPIFNNLIKMANAGDTKGVEEFAKNIMKEKGMDFNKEFSNFMTNFK